MPEPAAKAVSPLVCPCGGGYAEVVADEAHYRIVRCERCELLATDPRDIGEAAYDQAYFKKNYLDRLERWQRSHSHWFKKVVAPRMAGIAAPRLLDVGSGIGLFLSVVPPRWTRVGVEPSASACEIARARFGLDVRTQRLEELEPGEGFDVVTFWDVVEHLPDPVATLRAAMRHLRPRGVIIVKVPHIGKSTLAAGRALARLGKGTAVFHIGAHLYQFDERTLRSTLRLAGLRADNIESHGDPYGVRAFFSKGRLTGRLARLALHLGRLDHSLIAVARPDPTAATVTD